MRERKEQAGGEEIFVKTKIMRGERIEKRAKRKERR